MSLKSIFSFLLVSLIVLPVRGQEVQEQKILSAHQINNSTIELIHENGIHTVIDFYADDIFRYFHDPKGGVVREPVAIHPADILVPEARKEVSFLKLSQEGDYYEIQTKGMSIRVDKNTALMTVYDPEGKVVLEQIAPVSCGEDKTVLTFKESPEEYFYGGGVQNGRFSHKGKAISIVNENSWTDGGVASPAPFYWSTNGYGLMWYTFQPGQYDFGKEEEGKVKISHNTNYLDVFVMVDQTASELLADYYQLTGNPILLPKFGFYEGHLNAYNRDFWKEIEKGGVVFEDGKHYAESQHDNGGIKETLNGEKDNYQFSARAAVDRYLNHDMPLGWFLPNDGYGAGYGQTETLEGNVENLRQFGEYARSKGVEIGLWTQSDLYPKEGIPALLQRDLVREVRDAGVRVLKTDVAWVGAGYSFGLNGITSAGEIMDYYGDNARSFIISLDGWAGTQRYAGVWSGDQSGGDWEYIRFHIPTYIGSGLSGMPNICSDMDGIFGGKKPIINTRDFQWKAFTLMQLNMDGWGANQKYPHVFGEPTTSINRWYLKLKSVFLPYTYSVAHVATEGLPIIRPMFLEEANPYTLGPSTQYQYMYGPSVLVAPIYKNTASDEEGNDIRNEIYLPKGEWIDYFTGELYTGGRIINSFAAPVWKLPVFIKNGAIIPMAAASNNPAGINHSERIFAIYPSGHSEFMSYDDDGVSQDYKKGAYVTTKIESDMNAEKRALKVKILPTKGSFDNFVAVKTTQLQVNVTAQPRKVKARVNNHKVQLSEVASLEEFNAGENVYYYDAQPNMNIYATPGSAFAEKKVIKNPMLYVKLAACDVTSTLQEIEVSGCEFKPSNNLVTKVGRLEKPTILPSAKKAEAYRYVARWNQMENADYYEIEFDDMLYSTICADSLVLEGLECDTEYALKLRSVNAEGVSAWTDYSFRTGRNPLEWVVRNVEAEATTPAQGGQPLKKLFDFNEKGEIWHTAYKAQAIPLTMIVDLKSVNVLEKMDYYPRLNAGNGTFLEGEVAISMDKKNWKEMGAFSWERNSAIKTFEFEGHPSARYIKIHLTKTVNHFASGRELYVFRVPESESYLQGDINSDGRIDENDFTSYMNYTGLRKGDSDFEGYVSRGDINGNGLIDAFDISHVATVLENAVALSAGQSDPVEGELELQQLSPRKNYKKGDIVEYAILGKGLKNVNAFSLAIPYSTDDLEYAGIEVGEVEEMKNLTRNRLHTNGETILYPTFTNVGEGSYLEGNRKLLVVKFILKRNVVSKLDMTSPCLVSKTKDFN